MVATAVERDSGRSGSRRSCVIDWDSRSPFATTPPGAANHTPDHAPVADAFVTDVTIIDAAHPFFGQRLPVVFRGRAGRGDHVLVKLPGGGRRAIPLAATSLADHSSGLGDQTSTSPSPVSVRTLLPVAHLVWALKRRLTEVPDASGHCSTSTESALTPSGDLADTGVAGSAPRAPEKRRLPRGRARSPDSPSTSGAGGSP